MSKKPTRRTPVEGTEVFGTVDKIVSDNPGKTQVYKETTKPPMERGWKVTEDKDDLICRTQRGQ